MTKQKYVVGFLFDPQFEKVVLIRKTKPEWQAGRVNGVGGKVEAGETYREAMIREFTEETGLTYFNWQELAFLNCPFADLQTFWGVSHQYDRVITTTEEQVEIHNVADLLTTPEFLPSILWLIPMALSFSRGERARAFEVTELYDSN